MQEDKLKKLSVLRLSNEESKHLTRESIQMALLQLLKDTPFEKITVTAIINRSGVSRAGFYRNYSSKEDVIQDICNEFAKEIRNVLKSDEYANNPHKFYKEFFSFITENPGLFKLLNDAEVPREFLVNALPLLPFNVSEFSPKEHYTFVAILSAFRAIAFEWFENGMKESANEMADIITELLKH